MPEAAATPAAAPTASGERSTAEANDGPAAADPPSPSRTARLLNASAVMAAGTAASRLLGFVRVVLVAALLSNGSRQADMLAIANTVPNSMYILLAGGVLNTVLVPQLVRAIKSDPDSGETYTNRVMTAGLIALGLITVVLTCAVPLIIGIYSGAGWKAPGLAPQYDSMITLGYYCMPQVFFYGVHVLAGQVLNARDRFGPMMWAPIANNIVSIAVLGIFWAVFPSGSDRNTGAPFSRGEELLLGFGTTAGIVLQALVLIPFLRAAGYHFRPRFDFRNTGLGRTFGLAKWTLGFVLVNQIALVVISRLASDATTGGGRSAGLAAYFSAYLVFILPHSLITVSLATAMLPSASRLAAAGDRAGVAAETTRTIRLALTALIPAAVAYLVLGLPLTRLAFGFGQGSADAEFVGWALMALALGLVPFSVQYIFLRAFYALENTRTPFWLQVIIAGANAGLGVGIVLLVQVPSLVAAGLALAYSLAYGIGVMLSYRRLRAALPDLDALPLLAHGGRLLAAVAPAAALAWLICFGIAAWSTSRLALAGSLALAGLVAVAVFALLARLLGVREVAAIFDTVRRRRTGTPPDATPPDRQPGGPGIQAGPPNAGSDGGSAPGLSADPPSIEGHADAAGLSSDAGDPTQDADLMAQAAAVRNVAADSLPESAGDAWAGATRPAGTVLGDRYRLEELVAEARPTITWRAFDQVLSRSVLIHLLAPGDPAAPKLLATARKASIATDSRFLRVLDAVHSADPAVGSYIVCEYAVGQTLELILHQGPLSGLEAAWVVREAADALSGVHQMGLFHRRINPNTVIITPTGNIKIVGLLIESELRAQQRPDVHGADTPELVDVLDLGRLLYASLVARWPGGPAYGMPDAPRAGRRWATPRQVRAGVSPALDNVCDQILSDAPRHKGAPITTANALVNALAKVLGTADAALDLERRLKQPVPKVEVSTRAPAGPAVDASDPDQPTQPMFAVKPAVLPAAIANPPRVTRPAPGPSVGATGAGSTAPAGTGPGTAGANAASAGGIRTGSTRTGSTSAARVRRRPQRWVGLLIVLTALLVAAAVMAALVLNQRLSGRTRSAPSTSVAAPVDSAPPTSAPPTDEPVEIVAAREFDPQGDPPNTEDPDGVARAYDEDPKTRWHTVTYRGTPKLGNLKRGVGLILDLGKPQQVRAVQLTLSGSGTAVDVRVPKGDAATAAAPPTKSDNQWTVIAADKAAAGTTTLRPDRPETTRFLLVYLTSLPKSGKGYQGGISEIVVNA